MDPDQRLQKGLTPIVNAYIKCGTKTMPGLLQSVHPTRLPQDTHEYALGFEVITVPKIPKFYQPHYASLFFDLVLLHVIVSVRVVLQLKCFQFHNDIDLG